MEIYLRQVHWSKHIHLNFHLSSSGGHHWKIRNQGSIHDSIIFIHILSIYIYSYIPRHPKIFALYELFQKTIPKLLRKSFTFLQVPPNIARLEKRSIKANGVSDLAQVANFGKYIKLLILGIYIYIYWNVLFQPVSSISRFLCSQGRVRTRLVSNYVRTMFELCSFWRFNLGNCTSWWCFM